MGRLSVWTLLALTLLAFATAVQDVRADVPSETECRPYIEKALHELKGDVVEGVADILNDDENNDSNENTEDTDNSPETDVEPADDNGDDDDASDEADVNVSDAPSAEDGDDNEAAEIEDDNDDDDDDDAAVAADDDEADDSNDVADDNNDDDDDETQVTDSDAEDDAQNDEASEGEADDVNDSGEAVDEADSAEAADEADDVETKTDNSNDDDSNEVGTDAKSAEEDDAADSGEAVDDNQVAEDNSNENSKENAESAEVDGADSAEVIAEENAEDTSADDDNSAEEQDTTEAAAADDEDDNNDADADDNKSDEEVVDNKSAEDDVVDDAADDGESGESVNEPTVEEATATSTESGNAEASGDNDAADIQDEIDDEVEKETKEDQTIADDGDDDSDEKTSEVTKPVESFPEDDLLIEYTIPTNLRDHSHVTELLRLDEEFDEKEAALNKVADVVLKDLKKIYDNSIKPLETLYKYRDLSNRHFGDPEIFSKPMVLFMGPWSGGKSTILNYLTDNEHTADSLRTGAEPSPAYFNILMHGDKPEVLDGTQLAADWTFSGLQKFGQGLEDRLRGQKLPHKLLEKVNIVEIPGILEVRKQVARLFPFNDACQWFIDRADIIFLVYDPTKLDVGPETEAILDQLKGREYQTRILLNKADLVKPEELLRVQGALIWNISPLMSSAQPPVMYTTSLWSHPYQDGAPVRLLQAQERALLRDLRASIDKRLDNKIASARRFAVRVRNHAKMVDCYLTTYYNHKTLFGNKNQIANNIIENPQNYHIYEGLSTLTNISRYDLPDPETYRDFFRLNKLYDFKKLSETCTYFRGCPINKLDVSIAYDLPELVGKYKKAVEVALNTIDKKAAADGGKS